MDQEIAPHGNGVALDFADQLPPGYGFCPTDSDLIVYYLHAKIESRKFPECRLHEVNIYNHRPEELAERYRSSLDKWYFLTPRDRKYPRGDRPNRAVKDFGFWKATQSQRMVPDATGKIVGHKTTLTFFVNKETKTPWIMKEYTTNLPNIPCGGNNMRLNEWVLCKIYKKLEKTDPKDHVEKEVGKGKNRDKKEKTDPKDHGEKQVGKGKNRDKKEKKPKDHGEKEVGKRKNREKVIKEPNGTRDIPLKKRRQASKNSEIRTTTNPFPNPMQPMTTTFGDSSLIQPSPLYGNQFTPTASNSVLLSNGASTSGSIEPPTTSNNNEIRTNTNPFPDPIQPATTFQDSLVTDIASWYQHQTTSPPSTNFLSSDGGSTFRSIGQPTILENNETEIRKNSNPVSNPMQPMTTTFGDSSFIQPSPLYGNQFMQPMTTTFGDSSLIQPSPLYGNQFTPTTSNSVLLSNGASTSGSIEPPTTSDNNDIRTNINPFPDPIQPATTFQDSFLADVASWYQNQITSTPSTNFLSSEGGSTFRSIGQPTILENNETEIRKNANPVSNPMQPMTTTFQDSNLVQPAPWYQNQITSTASNNFIFSDCALTYGNVESPIADIQPLVNSCYTSVLTSDPANSDVLQHNVKTSFQDPKTQLNVQSGSNHDMVVPHDPARHIPQPDGNNASPPDANNWVFDDFDFDAFDPFMLDCSPLY